MARDGRSRGVWVTPEVDDIVMELRGQPRFRNATESKVLQGLIYVGTHAEDRDKLLDEFLDSMVDERKLKEAEAKLLQLSENELRTLLAKLGENMGNGE